MVAQAFQLLMREGPTPGKMFTLSRSELVIGREMNNDIVINIAEVSRKHARLTLKGGGYIIEDLGSTNGTFVDGQRILGPHVLRPGEVVMLGDAVSLVYNPVVADPNATVISSPEEVRMAEMASPAPSARSLRSAPAPSYAGQVAPGPAATSSAGEGKAKSWVGPAIGCLVVLCIVVIGGAFLFDYLNMYCVPPFNMMFPCP